MSRIRVLLVGMSVMLGEIIGAAIADEADMWVVEGSPSIAKLGEYSRRRRIDAIILPAGGIGEEDIQRAFRANPRLCLLAVDAPSDRAVLHHLTPTAKTVDGLADTAIAPAIRAGVALRLG
jgi:hypothetical protein